MSPIIVVKRMRICACGAHALICVRWDVQTIPVRGGGGGGGGCGGRKLDCAAMHR